MPVMEFRQPQGIRDIVLRSIRHPAGPVGMPMSDPTHLSPVARLDALAIHQARNAITTASVERAGAPHPKGMA